MGISLLKDPRHFLGEAITRVTEALKREGFGVLTDVDVAAMMKAKLDAQLQPQSAGEGGKTAPAS